MLVGSVGCKDVGKDVVNDLGTHWGREVGAVEAVQ